MPGLSGLDVLAAIRQMPALNTVGVIMLTSVDNLPNVTKLRSLGWSAYLTKPIKTVTVEKDYPASRRQTISESPR